MKLIGFVEGVDSLINVPSVKTNHFLRTEAKTQ